jgi:hypothetical protein
LFSSDICPRPAQDLDPNQLHSKDARMLKAFYESVEYADRVIEASLYNQASIKYQVCCCRI